MRIAAAILLAFLAPHASATATPAKIVNLDRPGVLQALQRENPDHFRRVTGILAASQETPCQMDEFEKVTRVRFDARGARCGMIVKTSYPAKLQLSFALDDVRYLGMVTMSMTERLVPAK